MAKVSKPSEVDVAENGRPSLEGEDTEKLRHLYYQMLLLRRFEEIGVAEVTARVREFSDLVRFDIDPEPVLGY